MRKKMARFKIVYTGPNLDHTSHQKTQKPHQTPKYTNSHQKHQAPTIQYNEKPTTEKTSYLRIENCSLLLNGITRHWLSTSQPSSQYYEELLFCYSRKGSRYIKQLIFTA